MNASANLERRLRFDVKNDEHGYGYLECMEGKRNHEIHCDTLYLGMIAFAKEGHYPGFESITIKDLANKSVFENKRAASKNTLARPQDHSHKQLQKVLTWHPDGC